MHVEVIVGKIGRAHGIRGDVTIDVTTDEPERRFYKGATLRLSNDTTLEVARVRMHQGRLLVAFEGINDRTAVEALRGKQLFALVPKDEEPASDDEFYDRQLVGLEVRDAAGAARGVIQRVQHFPAQDLLIVGVGGEERMVPFVEALVPIVDIPSGYVQLADVQGLLEDVE